MDRTNYYSGLHPIVVQALNNLQYRYSGETPEMWCSRVRYPFKKLLEYNPKYFSKNGFIQMVEREYIDGEFKVGRRSFHIYCTVCDSLVIIPENTIECANKHLNECIAKTAKKRLAYSNPIQKKGGRKASELSKDEIYKICGKYTYLLSRGYRCDTDDDYELWKKIAYHIFNSAKVIQRAWRAFKLRPESWAQRVWNFVRNDGTPDDEKYLGIIPQKIKNHITRQQYDLRSAEIIAMINEGYNYPSPGEYKEYYLPYNWVEKKKEQLRDRLHLVSYIVAFIELHRQGYRIVEYSGWTYMLKWLSNPEYYRINERGNENIVRSSEYARYYCKMCGKPYPCDSLKINYFHSGYFYFQKKDVNIDFSDFNNNCEYVQRIFQILSK